MALHIGTHRQLFLDDGVIGEMAGLRRVQAVPAKHPGNPVLRRDKPWDALRCELSGSAVWDPQRKQVRLFYSATGKLPPEGSFSGIRDRDSCLALAESADGGTWNKPAFELVPYDGITKTGIVLGLWQGVDWIHGPGVFLDPRDPDPARRYKLFTDIAMKIHVFFSPDGIRWTPAAKNPVADWHSDTGNCPFWDPLLQQYVAYVRTRDAGVRCVGRTVSSDFETWRPLQTVFKPSAEDRARGWEFYQHSVTPYQGLYVGLTHIFHNSAAAMDPDAPSPITWPVLTVSRDGVNWARVMPDEPGRPFLPTGEPGAFDCRMIRTASSLVVLPDRLLLLYSGSSNIHHRSCKWDIGLATLRLDGFVAMAAGDNEGTLLTKPLRFDAGTLRINAAVQPGGYVKAEWLAPGQHRSLPGYAAGHCHAFTGDSPRGELSWDGQGSLPVAPVDGLRLRFLLKRAHLYSFWAE